MSVTLTVSVSHPQSLTTKSVTQCHSPATAVESVRPQSHNQSVNHTRLGLTVSHTASATPNQSIVSHSLTHSDRVSHWSASVTVSDSVCDCDYESV